MELIPMMLMGAVAVCAVAGLAARAAVRRIRRPNRPVIEFTDRRKMMLAAARPLILPASRQCVAVRPASSVLDSLYSEDRLTLRKSHDGSFAGARWVRTEEMQKQGCREDGTDVCARTRKQTTVIREMRRSHTGGVVETLEIRSSKTIRILRDRRTN